LVVLLIRIGCLPINVVSISCVVPGYMIFFDHLDVSWLRGVENGRW
jgi:hypothetical protein